MYTFLIIDFKQSPFNEKFTIETSCTTVQDEKMLVLNVTIFKSPEIIVFMEQLWLR